ncbi:hypothetical protein ZWY2020_052437 [Hordeum vulgare]|nr:hypothetical protein ZWY2020_052437 [Hordeum vulgare]
MIANKSWRLPAEGEKEPAPKEGSASCSSATCPGVSPCLPTPSSEEWTNWHFAVSNGNPAEEEEGSVDSTEYVSDSGETEEETEEEEEVGEQSSPPPPSEHRTKCRHDPTTPPAPPAAPSAPPAPPVAPSARSVKRTRDAAAEPTDQPSKVAKPSGLKPRKALPWMRIAVPVASAAATSAASLPHQDDDPMDTDNAATSQQVGLPSEVIHLEDDDQRGSGPALAPVLEVVPFAAAPTTAVLPTETMPPTETVPLVADPTGAELGMPKESSAVPGPSTIQYDARHLPEDQKTCEMGSAYNALKAEKIQLAAELEAAVNDLAGVKGALADQEKSLEESRETNKALVAKIEKMGRQRTEQMGQLKLMKNRCKAQEKYVSDWARKMIALLGDFCLDAEAEAADIEWSVVPNVPLGDEANRDMLRAHIHLGRVGPFIGRLREVIGRIDKELWPEDDSRQEIEGLMARLEDVPNRVQAWKKSAARCGADVALSLVRVHCKEAREEKLKAL